MSTKVVNRIQVNKKIFSVIAEKILDAEMRYELSSELSELEAVLSNEMVKLLKNDWVEFEKKDFRYNKNVVGLLPNFDKFNLGHGHHWNCNTNAEYMKFDGFKGEVLTLNEFKKIFYLHITDKVNNGKTYSYSNIINDGISNSISFSGHNVYVQDKDDCLYIPFHRLNGADSRKISSSKTIKLWLENKLTPKGVSDKFKKNYEELRLIYKHSKNHVNFIVSDELLVDYNLLFNDIKRKSLIITINGKKFNYNERYNKLLAVKTHEIKPEYKINIVDDLKNDLLNCDKYKAEIQRYSEKMLSDPNAGHWDLWEESDENSNFDNDLYTLNGDFNLMARNPLADIKGNGVVGIDFGTKSTVVTYLDNNKIMPMRVGTGDLSKKIDKKHYENPTVMEFINLNKFLNDYNREIGRPNTSWQDVVVSHTAMDDVLNANSTEFNAYINELKQWAGDDKRAITLQDKQGVNRILPPFHTILEDEFNPIEIYAYYIGVYINNMWNGIFLDYMLSFPVTYEIPTRQKISKCFERGLKKSLPRTVLSNEECMARFRIDTDISEPAAYAVCALQEYGFEPTGNEKVFYGIFDFGGGTTDFDFGLWREATSKERKYDYVIEHFGANGDKYLGGENLLELLSFEVFKANQDKIRDNKITFTLPPECKKFAGSEAIISDNQEARLNTKQLMEKLRPLWEREEGYEKLFESASIKVKLFNSSGEYKDYDLVVNQEELENIIENRIEKGVKNFFAALNQAFTFSATEGIEDVNIFLGGNSSKSQVVKDVFARYIEKETEKIRSVKKELEDSERVIFKIFPPLGSNEAEVLMEEMGLSSDKDNIEKPNGKTGVAFGLIKCRKGSKIKVVDNGKVSVGGNEEISFQYFIGTEKKGKFRVLEDFKSSKSIFGKPDYNKWYDFTDASIEDFEIFYTRLPDAINGNVKIENVMLRRLRIKVINDDASVFIRAVAPKVLEYVVATKDGIEQGEYLSEVIKISLDEN